MLTLSKSIPDKQHSGCALSHHSILSCSDEQWEMQMRDAVQPDYRYGAAGGIFPNSTGMFVSMGFSGKRYFDTFRYDTMNMFWSEGK